MNTLFDFNSRKREQRTNVPIEKLTFSEQFKSEENVENLTNIFIKELRYNTTNKKEIIKNLVKKYIDTWINLGKFKKIDDDMVKSNDYSYKYNMIIHYNNKFTNIFEDNIINELKTSDSQLNMFNPFRDRLQNKSIDNYTVDDYKNLYVQSDDNIIFDFTRRKSLKQNNMNIPIYEQQLYKRHYDAEDIGSLYEEKKENLQYKRYPIPGDLFNSYDNR